MVRQRSRPSTHRTSAPATTPPPPTAAASTFRPTRRPASDFNLNEPQPTHYEAFNVYVPYTNDWDLDTADDGVPDSTQPIRRTPTSSTSTRRTSPRSSSAPGSTGQATITGPLGYGSQQFVPLGQTLPYTIQFANRRGYVHGRADPHRQPARPEPRPAQLPPGRHPARRHQVHIPSGVGSFQGDFDFTQSKGFILASAPASTFSPTPSPGCSRPSTR